jgi:hypothetical protein
VKFSKDFLLDEVLITNDKIVFRKILGKRRWSIDVYIVFKHEDKFYQSTYSYGATESQDESPYEYDDDEIECEEVFPTQVVTTVYKTQKEIDSGK